MWKGHLLTMATLQGEWETPWGSKIVGDDARHFPAGGAPERVWVTATPDEFTRIGTLPDAQAVKRFTLPGDPDARETVSIPPRRELVEQVAKKVEVDVPDGGLVDWMSGKRG